MKKLYLFVSALLIAAMLTGCAATDPVGTAPGTAVPTEVPADDPTEAPVPTGDPAEDLPQWYVDNAYPLAQRIAEENGFEIDKAAAECTMDRTGASATVSFPFADGKMQLNIGASRSADGEFSIDLSGPYIGFSYDEKELEMLLARVRVWDEAYRSELITVTPEDIINAGCTETSGDEYMLTVHRCFAEKLAEKYLALEADAPGALSFARVMCVGESSFGEVMIKIAVVPRNFIEFGFHMDNEYGFVTDEESEFYGKAFIAGFAVLTQEEDGSWVGRSELATGV